MPDVPGVRVVEVGGLDSLQGYSDFVLRELHRYISTSHALIVQWDGFVLNPDAWDGRFLEYDYIGAIWPQYPSHISVGNGGFSLRSARLLEACADAAFVVTYPEDLCICHTNRHLLENHFGLRFPPPEVAQQFSYERGPRIGRPFGIHGLFNFPDCMDARELAALLMSMPSSMLRGRDTHDLCLRLLRDGGSENMNTAGWLLLRLLRGPKAKLPKTLSLVWKYVVKRLSSD